MIESCALFFSLLYLFLFIRMVRFPSTGNILGAVMVGSLAGLTKSTTFLIAATPAVLFAAGCLWTQWPDFTKLRKPGLAAAIGLLVPIGAVMIWTAHVDSLKMQNPLTEWLASHALTKWIYGTMAQRLSWNTWNQILKFDVDLAVSNGTRRYLIAAVILITAAILMNRMRLPIIALLAAFFTGPVLFTNLFFVHTYYSYEVSLYLQIAVGFAIIGLTESLAPASREGLRLVAWGIIFFWGAHGYRARDLPQIKVTSTTVRMQKDLEPLNKAGGSNDVLLIYGQDWNPWIPYYSGRKAIMVYDTATDGLVNQSIAKLDANEKIAALVVNGPLTNDAAFIKTNVERFNLSPSALETDYGRVFLKQ
jgi:hypothetical protein